MFFLIIGAGLVALPAVAQADGGFYGDVTYTRCDCQGGGDPYADAVVIAKVGGGVPPQEFNLLPCRAGYGHYDTRPATFPPGSYQIKLIFGEGSACMYSFVEWVVHGTDDQRVNLSAYGPDDKPHGGDE